MEEQEQLDQDPQVPENIEIPGADRSRKRQMPDSSAQDPDYEPQNSPHSPVTRSRARLQLQENPPV